MDHIEQLIETFLSSAEELKARIGDVERVIDRQGLDVLAPGTVVDKNFCDIEHAELEKSVCGRADKLEETIIERSDASEKSLNKKVYASWTVLVLVLGALGLIIKAHDAKLDELIKMVF